MLLMQSATDSLLNKLNTVLADRDVFVKQKQARIENLNKKLGKAGNTRQRYDLYSALFDEYKTFSYDSAYNYAKKAELAANRIK